MAYDRDKPFNLEIARLTQKHGFGGIIAGRNLAIGSKETKVVNYSGAITYVTEAIGVSIVSDNVADTSDGTGARKVFVTGLDSDWNIQTEEFTLTGTTPVTNGLVFIRLLKIWVTTAGSNETNVGNISASLDGNVQLVISAEQGESQAGFLSVPAGLRCYISTLHASAGKSDEFEVDLYTREFGKAWRVRAMDQVHEAASFVTLDWYLRLPPKTDIQLRATNKLTTTGNITAMFNFLWLSPSQEESTEVFL